jgi:aspartate carbamoyltransferase catalytic subunit
MKSIYWGTSKEISNFDRRKFRKFLSLPPEKIEESCKDDNGRLIHIIRAEHFELDFLEKICDTADAARRVDQLEDRAMKRLLSSKSVLNYFKQPSTRTFFSFSLAEAHLGMRREELREIKTSSEVKGESEKDSLRTISSYFDAIVCRHPSDIYDLFALWVMKNSDRELPIINAGSGKKEHPTQGVLDYYTIRKAFPEGLDGKTIVYVGDCKRGRTVHSLAKVMALHEGTKAIFVAPKELQIDEETRRYISDKGTKVIKTQKSLSKIVSKADVIYMTRVQSEHGGSGEYDLKFKFTKKMLDSMKEDAILMHPMPKREEIDPRIDYLKKDPRIAYWEQQRNGMWTRVALLAHIFGVDEQIREQYQKIQNAIKL